MAYVCSLVSTRAAHFCACGIAALLKRMNRDFVTVGVDGSVYRFHPTFKDLLDSKIDELVDGKHEVLLNPQIKKNKQHYFLVYPGAQRGWKRPRGGCRGGSGNRDEQNFDGAPGDAASSGSVIKWNFPTCACKKRTNKAVKLGHPQQRANTKRTIIN